MSRPLANPPLTRSPPPRAGLDAGTLLLGLATVATAALVWLAETQPIDTAPLSPAAAVSPPPGPGATHPTPAEAPLASDVKRAATLADLPATTARPLFAPDRRPPPPRPLAVVPVEPAAPPPPPAAAPPPLQAQLLGLARAGKRGLRALVRPSGEPHGTWLAVGDRVQGWTLTDIRPDKAVFKLDGVTQDLPLADAPAAMSAARSGDKP